MEIERKFLVKGEFRHLAYNRTHIEQGYIAYGNGRTVRVRIRDDRGYLTIKGPADVGGLSRYEFEKEIDLNDAHDLMKICLPGVVVKDRWLVRNGKHTIEVDEFFGANEGLVMAEIELNYEDEDYIRPDFLGREVTGIKRYYNAHMINYPYCLWTEDEKR